MRKRYYLCLIIIAATICFLTSVSTAQEVDCLQCHPDLKEHKVIHPALDMGCTACHVGLDVSDIPHKVTNGIDKGLMAQVPDLCYNCH
ncbi:MAG: hypothetical protein D6778_10160, partial [Nitrospirae bacterium]